MLSFHIELDYDDSFVEIKTTKAKKMRATSAFFFNGLQKRMLQKYQKDTSFHGNGKNVTLMERSPTFHQHFCMTYHYSNAWLTKTNAI